MRALRILDYRVALSVGVACLACAGLAADRDALARMLNARAGTNPKIYASSAEVVRKEADKGGVLQQYVIALVSQDVHGPKAVKLSERQRTKWLEGARGKIRALAESKNNALAWYLVSLDTGDMTALERAAAGGNVQALNAWGNVLIGDAARRAEGFQCFSRAAAKKDANAFYNMGMCYMQGYGCDFDAGRAFQCFRAAAEDGHPEAINNIGGFYRDGIVVPTNTVLSVRWFKKSAELGNAYGQLNYALALQRGDGVPRDVEAAVEMIRAACDQDCAEAMDAYGMCLHNGCGVKKDIRAAVEWFRKSAAGGCPNAMENLAECYERGEGVEKDIVVSAQWRMKAKAVRGDPMARAWERGERKLKGEK